MTNVNGFMSAHIVDQYGIAGETGVVITIPDTATIAQLRTDVTSFVTDTQNLTQGAITDATVKLEFAGSGVAPSTATGDIEKGGLFNLNNATDSYATGVLVPDLNPSVLTGAGLIDLSNASITTWLAYLTTAHTAITVVTKGIRALTALRDALITFRKHRKPLTRKTKEL